MAQAFDETQTLTLAQFSKLSGINDLTMSRWKLEGLISPPQSRGKYQIGTLIREVFAVAKTDRLPGRQASNPMQEAKIRGLEATASKVELQVAKAAGQLVEASRVEDLLAEAVLTARKKLEVMADRIASQVAGMEPDEAARLIRKEVHAALYSLADLDFNS
jgi:hypothetical protein